MGVLNGQRIKYISLEITYFNGKMQVMEELIDGLELSPKRKFLTIYLWIDKDTKSLQAKFFTYLSKD